MLEIQIVEPWGFSRLEERTIQRSEASVPVTQPESQTRPQSQKPETTSERIESLPCFPLNARTEAQIYY